MGLGGAPDKQLEPLFAESVISKEKKTETNHPMGWGGGVCVIQLRELIVSLTAAGGL